MRALRRRVQRLPLGGPHAASTPSGCGGASGMAGRFEAPRSARPCPGLAADAMRTRMRHLFGPAGDARADRPDAPAPAARLRFRRHARAARGAARQVAADRATTRRLLARLATAHPVVVISGRSRARPRAAVRGRPAGGHLRQSRPRAVGRDRGGRALVAGWRTSLASRFVAPAGVWIEDKRLVADGRLPARAGPASTEEAIQPRRANAAARAPPRRAPRRPQPRARRGAQQGHGARRIHDGSGAGPRLYVGDDRTDEDVFALTCRG